MDDRDREKDVRSKRSNIKERGDDGDRGTVGDKSVIGER